MRTLTIFVLDFFQICCLATGTSLLVDLDDNPGGWREFPSMDLWPYIGALMVFQTLLDGGLTVLR